MTKSETGTERKKMTESAIAASQDGWHRACSLFCFLLCAGGVAASVLSTSASAQELEPRAFSPSPIGTNFALAAFTHLDGDVSLDPSLPITNVHANINAYTVGYAHTFALLGKQTSVALALPNVRAGVTGDVAEVGEREADRTGIGDLGLRFAMNLLGGAALTPEEFAHRTPGTIVGIDLKIRAPTGQYDPSKLINIGSNRWAFKPEIGISQPIGKWFVDAIAGAWVFTDNNNFFGGKRRSEDPLYSLQLDAGYEFRPGLWLSANGTYYTGGETSTNGVQGGDRQQNTRYGITASAPLGAGWSTKFSWSRGLTTRIGGNYDEYTFALQYRWFTRY
ncbi:MAG TPA: transporter [Burkholderiales bacterium]|nr:transporter [Burkholderiales bacterium]